MTGRALVKIHSRILLLARASEMGQWWVDRPRHHGMGDYCVRGRCLVAAGFELGLGDLDLAG